MDLIKTKLNSCIENLTSSKVTEAKRGADELKELLDRDDVIEALNQFSIQNEETCTWNVLFNASHQALLQRIDKSRDTKAKSTFSISAQENAKLHFSSLVLSLVKKANHDHPHILCGTIIDAVIYVLSTSVYHNAVGDLYLDVLYTHVLTTPTYWGSISLYNWKTLFELTVGIFKKETSRFKGTNVIAVIELIIRHGCEHTSLISVIKHTIFDFMKDLVHKSVKENVDFQKHVFKLLVTACQQLKNECRIAVCKFSEDIFEKLLNMCQSKVQGATDKKQYLINFLLIAVECHHPGGVSKDSDIAFASDMTGWNHRLYQLAYYANNELEYFRIHSTKTYKLPLNFINLVVEVCNQVFREGKNFLDVTVNQTIDESFVGSDRNIGSKRRRISCGFPDMIDRLKSCDKPIDMWPCLSILSSLLSTYPGLVKEDEYFMLLQNISNFLSSSKDPIVTDYLCQCCVSLIKVRQFRNSRVNQQDEDSLWDSIWNTVLRTIGLNQNVEWSHKLLQHMLKHMWKPEKGNSVLKLYLSHVVRLSEHSLMTLYLLRLQTAFPNTVADIPVLVTLLQWLLPVLSDFSSTDYYLTKIPIEYMSHLIVLLCLKNNIKRVAEDTPESPLKYSKSSRISTGLVHALISYNSKIFLTCGDEPNTKDLGKTNKACAVDKKVYDHFLILLEDHTRSFLELCKSVPNIVTKLQYLSSCSIFIIHVLKFYSYYEPNVSTVSLKTVLSKVCVEFLIEIQDFLDTEEDIKKITRILELMSNFLQGMWTVPSEFSQEILENFYSLFPIVVRIIENINDIRVAKMDDKKNILTIECGLMDLETLSECDRLRLEACRVLTHFSFHFGAIINHQFKIMDFLLDQISKAFENESDRDLIIISIFSLQVVFNSQNLYPDLIPKAVEILRLICKNGDHKWVKTEESVMILLQFIRQAILVTHKLEDQLEWKSLTSILDDIQTIQDECGVTIATEIVNCWGAFLKVNFDTAVNISFDLIEFIMKCSVDIIGNLKHSFHEVRMNAMNYVYKIFNLIDLFSSVVTLQYLEESDILILFDMAEKIVNHFEIVLNDLFLIGEQDLVHDEHDEEYNRLITVFYALASAICGSMKYRRRFISFFFQLTYDKKLKQSVASKILHLIKDYLKLQCLNDLMNDNIRFVLYDWFEKYKTFKNIPFQVMQCTSLREFFKEYSTEIVVIYSFYGDTEKLEEFAKYSDVMLKKVFKDNFAEIMSIIFRNVSSKNKDSSLVRTATKMYNFMVKHLSEDDFNRMLPAKLARLLTNIIGNFHDPSYQVLQFSILPLPSPNSSDLMSIKATLEHLQKETGVKNVFLYATEQNPMIIPRIFKALYAKVVKASTSEVRLEYLQQYTLFCNFLIPHYDDLSKANMTVFVCFTIVHHILNFLSIVASHESFIRLCLDFFYDFITKWLPTDHSRTSIVSIFSECLSSIVEKLIVLISTYERIADISFKILDYLLISQCANLLESINALDRFPDDSKYEKYRLAMEIQDTDVNDDPLVCGIKLFLVASEKSPNSPCRYETLKYLRKQLRSYKGELVSLFRQCPDTKLLSEDCVRSIPHRLICTLVKQTRSVDENVRLEAINCLCEIGLVDLHTLVLQPSQSSYSGTVDPKSLLAEYVICILKENLIDEDVEVMEKATRILFYTLLSPEGFQFVTSKMKKIDKEIFHPFIPHNAQPDKRLAVWTDFSIENFKLIIDCDNLWIPAEYVSFNTWISNLVSALCSSFSESCFVNALQTICHVKVSISVKVFKYLINLLTACEKRDPIRILGNRINQFLENCLIANGFENYPDSYSSASSTNKDCNVFEDKATVQCFLDVADFVRLNQIGPDGNEMQLNYLLIAKAALLCSEYFAAILFTELHVNSLIIKYDVEYNGNIISYLEELSQKYDENHDEILILLREAFCKIGDKDALYGCGSPLLLSSLSRILHYQQVENWQRVLESCETSLAFNPNQGSKINDFMSAIGNSGYNYLQNQYLESLEELSPQLKDAQYQSGWKLCKWDLVEPCDHEKTFSYYQYAAIKDLHESNFEGVRINIDSAKAALIPSVNRICLESTKNIYQVLSKFQCLQDIEVAACSANVNDVIEKWKNQDTLSKRVDFGHKQMILNQRVRLLDLQYEEAQEFILNVARKARKEHNFNFTDACLALIKRSELHGNISQRVDFEEACLLWERKDTYVARLLLKDLIKRETQSNAFHAVLLKTYGKWLSEINFESADTIFDQYLLKSLEGVVNFSVETLKARKTRVKAYKQVAEFADQEYQQICEYMKSMIFEELSKNVDESKRMADAMGNETEDLIRSRTFITNQSKIGASEVREIKDREQRYLNLAMHHYLKVLAESEEDNLKVFRVASFWLHQKSNAKLHLELKNNLPHIPSYKFIPVLPQLMAHITQNTAECFGNILNELVEKCATEHPHHTLPLIFSLANYTRDEQYIKQKKLNDSSTSLKRRYSKVENKKSNEDRVAAASNIIAKLKKSSKLNKIIMEMEKLYDAYIEIAYWSAGGIKKGGGQFPSDKLVSKIKNLNEIFCPTIEIPINKRGEYNDVIGVRKIDEKFRIFCGINHPKKIHCLCTDGEVRDQFIKGEDDLRVDAVMQQVFGIMNKLLMENKHTSKRELLLRTYKIVPLSQRSGVLEFCTNTMSLNEYLVGEKLGAHKRFRPNDMEIMQARSQMQNARNDREEKKKQVFLNICSKLKPVFRYFFLEHFRLPAMWFERKLAYIHSVATTSMVGYILGIGDRHGQNILIDTKTAELIHIDFGIAFDQGLNLNCAEHVPFRLTRDIEDGMGILSIDGIFRRCCEQVMAVLRQNSEIIRTTSEVFVYDPLYIWTVAEEKKSTNMDREMNVSASRALSRLKLKLQGMEDGSPTNVEGQVNRLIQQAKDVNNLCRLFHGWQPYL